MQTNKIINGDCIEVMKTFADNSVDCIICDPPYGVSLDDVANETIKVFRNSTKNTIITSEWDRFDDYLKFTEDWMKEAYRVLKPKGWFCIWNDFRRIKDVHIVADKLGLRLADLFVWSKSNAPLGFPDGFTKSNEFCLIFNKTSKDPNYSRYMSKELHKDFIVGNIVSDKERQECSYHPSPKPRYVIYPFINKFTKEGDIILDPFSGSGSILVSALELNRKFIGIEKDEKYFKESCLRLDKVTKTTKNRITQWL